MLFRSVCHDDIADHMIRLTLIEHAAKPDDQPRHGKHDHKNKNSFDNIAVFLTVILIFHAYNSCFLFFVHCVVSLLPRSRHMPSQSSVPEDV